MNQILDSLNSSADLSNLVNNEIALGGLVTDIVLTAVMAMLLKYFYIKFGNSLSNRKRLANNFVAIAVTTALVIMIVKSSLALSLGLVGALSIVRFRTAIKEPEELSYLFICIALGLGFGAHQQAVTLVAFTLILGILWLQGKIDQKDNNSENLFLHLSSNKNINLELLIKLISKHSSRLELKKSAQAPKEFEAAFLIKLDSTLELAKLSQTLKNKYPSIKITYTDPTGLL